MYSLLAAWIALILFVWVITGDHHGRRIRRNLRRERRKLRKSIRLD